MSSREEQHPSTTTTPLRSRRLFTAPLRGPIGTGHAFMFAPLNMLRDNFASFLQANFLICKMGLKCHLVSHGSCGNLPRDVEVYVMYIVFIEHLLRARHCSIRMCLSFFQERGIVDFNIMELRRSRKLNKDTPEMGTLTCPSQTLQQAHLCFSQASLTSGSENFMLGMQWVDVVGVGAAGQQQRWGRRGFLLVIQDLDLMGAGGELLSC